MVTHTHLSSGVRHHSNALFGQDVSQGCFKNIEKLLQTYWALDVCFYNSGVHALDFAFLLNFCFD